MIFRVLSPKLRDGFTDVEADSTEIESGILTFWRSDEDVMVAAFNHGVWVSFRPLLQGETAFTTPEKPTP